MAALGACGFATKGIFAKLLYASGWDYLSVITLRAVLALPLLWLWAIYRMGARPWWRASPSALLGAGAAGLFCYYAGALLDFKALMLIDASIERVLVFAYPSLVVVLHALFYRQWPTRTAWLSLALTYVGIFMVVSGLDMPIFNANLKGAGLVLFCAFTFAVYYLASDRYTAELGSVGFTLAAVTCSATALSLHYVAVRGLPAAALLPWHDVAILFGLVIFATTLPMVFMAEGVRHLGAPRAAVVSTVGPPTTILLGAFLLGEALSRAQWLGVALIVAGILVLELQHQKR